MAFTQFNTIRFKLSFIVGMLTVLYSSILVSYFNYKYKQTLLDDAIMKSRVFAENYAVEIKSQIESALDISRTTAQIFSSQANNENPLELTRNDASFIIRSLVDKNSFLLGMYTAWEANKFDNKDAEYAGLPNNHPDGHFVPYWYRDTETNKLAFEPLKHYLVEGLGDYYLKPRQTKKETVIDPISYKIGDRQVLLMTLVVPILNSNGDFLGIVGTDISSESIQKLINNNKIFEGFGQTAIISNNGTVVAVSNQDNLSGKTADKVFPEVASRLNSLTKMESFIENDTLRTYVPIYFGATERPWYVIFKISVNYLTKGLLLELIKLTLFGLVFLAILIFVTSYFIMKFLKPVRKITRVAQKVAIGNLDVWDVDSTSFEIEQLNDAFKKVIDSQKDITEVTKAIAAGDYNKKAVEKSEHDLLSKSVNQMIENLKKSTEEDNKRKWSNEGYANFSELLRNNENLENICINSLSFIIKYVKANQGGVFLKEENDDIVLELKASYAYDRQKFLKKSIQIGEGLVGQCYLEKEITMITEIPQDYVYVTSGLGDSTPSCIILLPLINNDEVVGILEIASFKVFEQYQIDFLEKCCASLASVISSARINELTNKLLLEAQQKTEQMKLQEEEMRQNMEELAATQEEMRRREEDYIQRIAMLENK